MAEVFVGPSRLQGVVTPPPAKSFAHRAFIAAVLAAGSPAGMDQVKGATRSTSADVAATMNCLDSLYSSGPVARLDCQESGSTLRFMIPLAAALGRDAQFVGSGRLAQRPLAEYRQILAGKGVSLDFSQAQGSLPLGISGQLQSGAFLVPGHVSSQYITGLLLALPLLAGDSAITLTSPLESAPYVDITLAVLAAFGIQVETNQGGWLVPGRQRYRLPAAGYQVESDYSQAAFWLVAKYLGHSLAVTGLAADSVQGDRAIIPLLAQLSKRCSGEPTVIDASQFPDLAPVLSVACSQTAGKTTIANAGRLRLKESDRLLATAQGLAALGADVVEGEDSLIIQGGRRLTGGRVDAHNDHRIVMAMAIAGLSSETGVCIVGAEAVAKSYPTFFTELARLGGDVRGLNLG